jgi:hypothetical protein
MNKHCCQNVQTISFVKTFKVLVWILSGVVGAPWSMYVRNYWPGHAFDQDWFLNNLFISGLLVHQLKILSVLDLRSVGPLKINLKLGECTRLQVAQRKSRCADRMRNPTCKKNRKSSNGFVYR